MIQLKNTLKALGIVALLALTFVSCARKANDNQPVQTKATETPQTLPLGAFSMSLNVKDLAASKLFYENLGFTSFGGGMEQNYLIMKNGNALIGLFQGMFEGNILTFNPGWDENAKNTASFTACDVSRAMCLARYTTPKPPRATAASTLYFPSS